jgi:SAM-dependent methyltransferase
MSSSFIHIACPICGADKAEPLFRIDYSSKKVIQHLGAKEPEIRLVRCASCHHRYADPIIDPSLIASYYSSDDSELYRNTEPVSFQRTFQLVYQAYLRYIRRSIKDPGVLLDVGCGYGFFLKVMSDAGWKTYGIEPSPQAYRHARDILNLQVTRNLLSPETYPGIDFNVISLIDVIEHLSDPNAMVRVVRSRLAPHGHICIATGDIESMNARIARDAWGYFGSYEHISFYSRRSIAYLLSRNGFAVKRIYSFSVQPAMRDIAKAMIANTQVYCKNSIKRLLRTMGGRYALGHGLLIHDHMFIIAQKSAS